MGTDTETMTPTIEDVWTGRDRRHLRSVPRTPCRIETETDAKYLDIDGDGLLDAVELTESLVAVGTDFRRILSTRKVVLSAIDDDGEAHAVTVLPA